MKESSNLPPGCTDADIERNAGWDEFPDMAQDVVDFHVKYGINYGGPPRRLPQQLHDFRVIRGLEEVYEYRDATDLEKELDAQIDEIYIALGTLHLHGFTPEMIAEAWRRVHAANMAKERSNPKNLGKYKTVEDGEAGGWADIVKPKGWVGPNHSDLCGEVVK